MTTCKACRKPIAESATKCPHCGNVPDPHPVMIALMFVVFGLVVWGTCAFIADVNEVRNTAKAIFTTP